MTRGRSGGGRGGRETLRTRSGRSTSSARWLERQLADPYVRRAEREGWRARSAYKLLELDQRFSLLPRARRIVDLGAAPGSWLQVARQRAAPGARLVGIDLLPVEPVVDAQILLGDVTDPGMVELLAALLDGPADLVLSDMAANSVGHARTDQIRTLALVESAAALARQLLRPGGAFLVKVLGGGADRAVLPELKRDYAEVRHAKPPASRRESSETYLVAMGFRGRSDDEAGSGPE